MPPYTSPTVVIRAKSPPDVLAISRLSSRSFSAHEYREWLLDLRPSTRARHDVSKDAPEPIECHRLCHVQVEARLPSSDGRSAAAVRLVSATSQRLWPNRSRITRATSNPSSTGKPRSISATIGGARARRRCLAGRPQPPPHRSPPTPRLDATSHGCLRDPRRRECVAADRDRALGSAPRIRCLHEWGGNGHHLARAASHRARGKGSEAQVAIFREYLVGGFQRDQSSS